MQLLEFLEHPLLLIFTEAPAVIADTQPAPLALLPTLQTDMPRPRMLQGIAQQVAHDALDQQGIAVDPTGRRLQLQPAILTLGLSGRLVQQALQQGRQIEVATAHAEPTGHAETAVIEQGLQHAAQLADRQGQALADIPNPRRLDNPAFAELLGIQRHGMQRLTQVMADRRQQATTAQGLRLGPLPRLLQQTGIQPGAALATLLDIAAGATDQVGAAEEQQLVEQLTQRLA